MSAMIGSRYGLFFKHSESCCFTAFDTIFSRSGLQKAILLQQVLKRFDSARDYH